MDSVMIGMKNLFPLGDTPEVLEVFFNEEGW
jgi:hypothetical protein